MPFPFHKFIDLIVQWFTTAVLLEILKKKLQAAINLSSSIEETSTQFRIRMGPVYFSLGKIYIRPIFWGECLSWARLSKGKINAEGKSILQLHRSTDCLYQWLEHCVVE